MKIAQEFFIRSIYFFWPISVAAFGYIGFLFLDSYYTWEQYAYPPHTYYSLIGGVVCLVVACTSAIIYYLTMFKEAK